MGYLADVFRERSSILVLMRDDYFPVEGRFRSETNPRRIGGFSTELVERGLLFVDDRVARKRWCCADRFPERMLPFHPFEMHVIY